MLRLREQPEWTVLVYVAGDNNLEGAAIDDVNEMEAVRLPSDLQVGVLVDRSPGYDTSNGNWTDTRVGVIQHDSNLSTISSQLTSWGERDTGTTQLLSDFISWGTQALPRGELRLGTMGPWWCYL